MSDGKKLPWRILVSGTDQQVHRAPADQPHSVRELTERLFPAYTVDDGAVHLAGCRLEDRLFIRTTDTSQGPAVALTMDDSGQPIEERFAQALGMNDTVNWVPPPEMPPHRLEEITRLTIERAKKKWGSVGDTLFIWCKHADGKLRFTIGDESVDLPFSGWARTLEAPPFCCPHSGVESFHLAATDDGTIAAAESIQVCSETGRRVLASQLVTCGATGNVVLADLTRICPVSERPVLERVLTTCTMCCQRVSPNVVRGGRCLACRSTRSIAKDEAPLAAILEKYPNLNRWQKWVASTTSDAHIFLATGWWKRLLLVVDRSSLEVRYTAVAQRFSEFTAVATQDLEELA